MNTELKMLFASAMLALLSFIPYLLAYIKHWGMTVAVGNRENVPSLPAWANRSKRAHNNLTENLVHFSAIVLIAQLTGISNEITVLGASLFFYARILYVFAYTLGIPWIRTFIFIAGVIGELMIASQLISPHFS